MKISFTDIIIFFQFGCMLASAIFSIGLIANKTIPGYMKNFYWYSLVAGVLVIFYLLQEYLDIVSMRVSVFIYNIFLIFHFIFLCLFIYNVLPTKNVSKNIKILFYLFLLTILFYIIANGLSFVPSTAISVTNLGLVISCCIYYFRLFKSPRRINLLKEPSFWIVTGIFFGMSATIPIVSLREYLHNNLPLELAKSIIGVGAFGYSIMHLFL